MAISIDTVYQKVLALANKEQRGYITPQEFNLFADQAQFEIFEEWFYDLNQQARIPGNEYIYADTDDILEDKIQFFETINSIGITSSMSLSNLDIYQITRVEYNGNECEILKTKDFERCKTGGPLTLPNNDRPLANIRYDSLTVIGSTGVITPDNVYYIRKPTTPTWGYVVVGGKAMYDSLNSIDFEIHSSEENKLIYKILKFAGISIQREDLTRSGQGLELSQIQREKQ